MYVTAILVSAAGVGLVIAAICWPVWFPRQFAVAEDRAGQANTDLADAERTSDYAAALPAGKFQNRDDLIRAMVPAKPTFDVPREARDEVATKPATAPQGCIVGSQMAFRRDTRGNFIHRYPSYFPKISITVYPPSKSGRIQTSNAVTGNFTIVDDSHSGVYDVDAMNIYAPFETVQLMAGMRPDPDIVKDDPTANFAPRCQQLLIRLTPEAQHANGDLKALRQKIDDFVQQYVQQQPLIDRFSSGGLFVQTWDEKQARYLGAVENEKTMMTFIMLLMSVVVLVVIFLIFYQIVRDKTRDIGIIKAVGGSEEGVAAIFLSYGLMIGIVGGGLGALGGCLFMTHTNQIHEWIFQMTGIIIWDRSVYLFDRIPDVVHPWDVVTYYGVALVAGVVGALIPAVLAALEDPVQAVRYE